MGRARGLSVVIESRRAIYLFPLAFLLNASSMTILLIAVGVMGRPELAAEIAIVQGATLAIFFAFSANARSIILGESSKISWLLILRSRVVLLAPLGAAALVISLYLTDATPALALALVLRRCSEWISEIYLARREREKNYGSAQWFIATQSLLLVVVIVSVIADTPFANIGVFLWALSPMVQTSGFLRNHFRIGNLLDPGWVHMLPHFGSTAITGITAFAFRLVILLIVGKAYAGNLFTAFAIGGILGTVFAQALGPTLVFHAKQGSVSDLPGWLRACLLASVGTGIALVFASVVGSQVLVETGKPAMFWSATGASLIGGAVMVFAQRFRLRLLQHHEDGNAFGPDVLTNIFIVACVPYVYYLLGVEAMSYLFLINAVIALVFYASADRTASSGGKITSVDHPILGQAIAAGLMLPVFFQLTGRIFRDKVLFKDGAVVPLSSGGDLLSLPIPISVIICYGAIIVVGRYNRARESLYVIFLSFCLMLLSTALSTHGDATMQQAKVILLIQFILPMLALVLGQIYRGSSGADGNLAKAFLYVVALVIPLELAATWNQNLPLLTSYLYVFSVYQHLQYVPLVLVCAFVIACFSLWPDKVYRTALMTLAIPIGAYAMLSLSMLTVGGLLIGSVTFVAYRYLRRCGKDWIVPLLLLLMIAIGIYGVFPVVEQTLREEGKLGGFSEMPGPARAGDDEVIVTPKVTVTPKVSVTPKVNETQKVNEVRNVTERLEIWKFYVGEIAKSGNVWLLGHATPPDRRLYPSAHNYYLDFAYNFGFVAMFPILWLIGFTLWKSGRYWKGISANPSFFALVGVVVFLLLVDNSLKVSLRQPYSGIVTFFLWGVLLSRLRELGRTPGSHRAEG